MLTTARPYTSVTSTPATICPSALPRLIVILTSTMIHAHASGNDTIRDRNGEEELAEFPAAPRNPVPSGCRSNHTATAVRDFAFTPPAEMRLSESAGSSSVPSGANHTEGGLESASVLTATDTTGGESVTRGVLALRERMLEILRTVSLQTYGPKSTMPSSAHAMLVRPLKTTGEMTDLRVEVPSDTSHDGAGTVFRGVCPGEDTRSPNGTAGLGFLADETQGIVAQQMPDVELIDFETPIVVEGRPATLALCQRQGECALMTFIVPDETDAHPAEDTSAWSKVTAITTFARVTLRGLRIATWTAKDRTARRFDELSVQLLCEITPETPTPECQTSVATLSTADQLHRLERPARATDEYVHDLLLCRNGKIRVTSTGTDTTPASVVAPVDLTYFTERVPIMQDPDKMATYLQEVEQLACELHARQVGSTQRRRVEAATERSTCVHHPSERTHGDEAAVPKATASAITGRARLHKDPPRSRRAARTSKARSRSRSVSRWLSSRWQWKLRVLKERHRGQDDSEAAGLSSAERGPTPASSNERAIPETSAPESVFGIGQGENSRVDPADACAMGDTI